MWRECAIGILWGPSPKSTRDNNQWLSIRLVHRQQCISRSDTKRKPVRLNRQAAIVLGSGLVAAIAIGLTEGLRDVSSSPAIGSEAVEQAPIYQDHVSAVLPDFDYRTLTRPAALTVIKEPPKNIEKSPTSETAPVEPAQVKATTSARDPHAEEEEAALRSGLFPPGAPTSSAAVARPVSAVPRDQDNALAALEQLRQRLPTVNELLPKGQRSAADQRQSFLNAELDQSIYLKNGPQKPLSDYEIKAGTVIPSARSPSISMTRQPVDIFSFPKVPGSSAATMLVSVTARNAPRLSGIA